ncbi:MAG: zf-HC2 domain-containing protein [Acidobacteria bacterium]|nr:zf-HC2 domain-containing protein [Acidobacteriota bacterium]
MPDCSRIDALVTPFVDGELPEPQQQTVADHIAACPPCRAKVSAERAIRTLLHARRPDLHSAPAPADLRARCAKLAQARRSVVSFPASTARQGGMVSAWRARLAPFALAATLLLAVAGAFVYQATRSSSRLLAAELAMDHEKCFRLNHILSTARTPDAVQASMASWFDWNVQLPDTATHDDVSLVGSRPCLYGEGKVAHIMFMHQGQPVSLFMLPRETRQEQVVTVFGHQARMWSEGDRTFVLVAKQTAPELDRMVALVRTTIR